MREYPEWATSVGFPGQNGRWTDMSLTAIERRKKELNAPIAALKSIDRAKLSKEDQLNYDLFDYGLNMSLKESRFPNELMPINQLQGVQEAPANTLVQNPQNTIQDYDDIVSRLRGIAASVDQSIELMKVGVNKGVTPPQVTLRDVPQQIQNQIVEDPMKSPLLEAFKKLPADFPEAEKTRLKDAAVSAYTSSIKPAYQKLHKYFTEEYLPKTRTSLACSELPNGKEWYAFNVHQITTTDLTPAQIHERGQQEVKRIRGEMEKLIAETGFKGNFADFSKYLRTDPKFFYTNAEELLAGYRDIAKRVDPQLMKQFGKLPRLQYGVEPIPAFNEKSQPTAYYRPGSLKFGRAGMFLANTYNVGTRPKWEMEALTLHEAVPGHHLQIAISQELEKVPDFRKHEGYTAFVEGWGLYAESLGHDMEMYKDPYSRYGQLTYEMWRAIRLVLDTGIHSMGWTRQQAIDFFKDNSSKSEHDITVEVDRYIVWPGQATAYKIGQMFIKDLRQDAKKELADNFNVRDFHDVVLRNGAVPLDVLKTQVEDWVSSKRKQANAK
ncbi:MAG TPA: DUF885 domain-containing protein [Candidatus Melainabacteria bacterium]|nr:DUF885 domain-containing protein [Candidatus Melainabacteria bacterium]HIN65521.1 DUF885 domain-containing protein [Candidatus Obscuribacterales bacterium]